MNNQNTMPSFINLEVLLGVDLKNSKLIKSVILLIIPIYAKVSTWQKITKRNYE
jgi:hypothetical protein